MKKILMNSTIIFIISTLIHSLYNYLPCFFTLIFVPINESIFEHLKMIFTSYMLFIILKYLFFNKKYNSKDIFIYFICGILNIIIFLVMYLPIYYTFKEILIVTLIIYFVSIVLSNILIERIANKNISKKAIIISKIGIVIVYIIFTLLSLYPLKVDFFFDPLNNKYGKYKLYS